MNREPSTKREEEVMKEKLFPRDLEIFGRVRRNRRKSALKNERLIF